MWLPQMAPSGGSVRGETLSSPGSDYAQEPRAGGQQGVSWSPRGPAGWAAPGPLSLADCEGVSRWDLHRDSGEGS